MSQSLIICATPRSGSYLLSDLLHQGGLPFAEEWLTPFHQSARKKSWGERESLDFVDYLQLLSERERCEGVFSMKIMYPQFYRLMGVLDETSHLPGSDWFGRFRTLFPNPVFVLMTRQNKLAQAISHLKARQTGQWVKRRNKEQESAVEPVYSFLGICKALEDREKSEALWNTFFKEFQIPVVRVTYEALVEDPVPSLARIFSVLGMPFDPGRELQRTRTFLPMASGLNRDWEQQFQQDRQSASANDRGPGAADPASLVIRDVAVSDPLEVGQRHAAEVRVSSPADFILPGGGANGSGWLRVVGTWIGEGDVEAEPFEQELRSGPDGELVARFLLPPVNTAGDIRLKLALTDRYLEREELLAHPGHEQVLRFRHPPAREAARQFLPGITDLRNGWQYLEWFGYFLDDKFPWVYTADHEWLYFRPERAENGAYHILDANLGWLELTPRIYPRLHSLDHDKDWEFLRREGDKRWFRETDSGKEFRTETNRPEHLRKLNPEAGP